MRRPLSGRRACRHVQRRRHRLPDWRCSFRRSGSPRRCASARRRRRGPDAAAVELACQRRRVEIGARQRRRGQRRQRVRSPRAALRACQAEFDLPAWLHRRAGDLQLTSPCADFFSSAHIGCFAKADRLAVPFRRMRLPAGNTSTPPGCKPCAKLIFFASDRLDAAKIFQMHRLHVHDHARPCGRVSSLNRAISPGWFMPISNTAQARIRAGVAQRQRHAPVIVEAARTGIGAAGRRAITSLVLVLPALPVRPITGPLNRARAARASVQRPSSTCPAPPAAEPRCRQSGAARSSPPRRRPRHSRRTPIHRACSQSSK